MSTAAAGLIGDVIDNNNLNVGKNKELEALRKRIKDSTTSEPQVPNSLNATLRDYQLEGYEWMWRVTSWGAGACLADDMGLGKTLQTITLLLDQAENGAALVVAPASVVPNWRNELARFAPTLNVTILNSADDREKAIDEAGAGDVVVSTYALLNIQHKKLSEKEWDVVCLDEAHTIKNPNTKMSKAAMMLQAKRKVILTGTPIQNHLSELWNLFQFINPGLLGSAEQFGKKFIEPIENKHDKERQRQLRRLISPFLLRRTKNDVLDELPEKNEITMPVELSDEEMKVYEVHRRMAEKSVRADKTVKVSTLAEITKLREMACSVSLVDKKWKHESSKVAAFVNLAENLNDSGNRALVFSQFTSFFDQVRKAMDKAKLPYLYLDGSTPMGQREALVKKFQHGECPFFLISLKAGGLGLNLTGANYVIHLDPWWNPAIEQQATDRAYRIGQKQDVTVYHLISQHTIEEKILRLHKSKRDLADSLLEGTDMGHALTQEELLELLA
jgi:SNF2 family DNA or RNA helicase